MMRFVLRTFAALTTCAAILPAGVTAQTSNATLHGTVTDTSGGVLPGVTVKLQAPSTGLNREQVTNAAGVYVFNFLPAGQYVVTAECRDGGQLDLDEADDSFP